MKARIHPRLVRGCFLSLHFCTLDRGHIGNCASAGTEKPPEAIWFEDDKEEQVLIAKQRADEAKRKN